MSTKPIARARKLPGGLEIFGITCETPIPAVSRSLRAGEIDTIRVQRLGIFGLEDGYAGDECRQQQDKRAAHDL